MRPPTQIFARLLHRLSGRWGRLRTAYLCRLMGAAGEQVVIYHPIHVEPYAGLYLGSRVSIGPFVQIWAHAPVIIGDDVMIAAHAVITSATHDPDGADPMNLTRIDRPVHIGNGAWIGAAAVIMPGVTIGPGAVIGAGAVVTRDVAARAVVAGVPARVLRMRPPP